MTPEKWQELERILHEALELPAAERPGFLDRACGGDDELRREAAALVAADEKAGEFIARPLLTESAPSLLEMFSGSGGGRLAADATVGGERTTPGLEPLVESRLPPGTLIADRYRIVTLLGRGGMGEVYRADDLKLGQQVALKFLLRAAEETPDHLLRFLQEVRLARQISHPNICRVYDAEEIDGQHFISMEYIDGENLSSLLKRIGRLPMAKALEIGRQLCLGLDAAHREGILHRDLKPSNLMIDSRGQAKITDFGLAVLASGRGARPHRYGTPAYMAPELLAGQEATVQSDLYALGLVLYQMFTGRRPFESDSVLDLVERQQDAPPPPSQWVPGLEGAVEQAILACLEKDPERRPLSALATGESLATGGAAIRPALKAVLVGAPLGAAWEGAAPPAACETLLHLHGRLLREVLGEDAERVRGDRDLLLFDRPIDAVRFALAYHGAVASVADEAGGELGAAIGIHLAEVGEEGADGIRQTIEPRALAIVQRLARLASRHQTLLTRAAFDLARQSPEAGITGSNWLAHGSYEIEGLDDTVEIFEFGLEGFAPLRPPADSDTVHRQRMQSSVAGWRPAPGLELPQRPHWVLQRKLKEGGFGEVWLAAHAKTGERRVFKFCYDSESLRTLQREITLFRLLKETLGNRRDINRVLDWSFSDAPYFIEAEYTPGGSLVDWAEQQGGLHQVSLETRLRLVAQTAVALASAHSVGVLHKDVKPANVLVTSATEDAAAGSVAAQLSDFGIGLITDKKRLLEVGITAAGLTEVVDPASSDTRAGTRLYMAPELLEGKPATVQADIYALGVMLYQMVVGDFSRALGPGWERDVEDPLLAEDIAAAVDGDPGRRLGNAQSLADRLESLRSRRVARQNERRKAAEARRLRQEARRALRRRRFTAVVIGILILFGLGMSWMLYRVQQEAARANREKETASRVLGFFVSMLETADPYRSSHQQMTVRELLDRAPDRISSELEGQPEAQGQLMLSVGEIFHNLGNYRQSVSLFQEATDIWRQSAGPVSQELADSLEALARAHLVLGEEERAEPHALEAAEIRSKLYGTEHIEVAQSLITLADVRIQQDQLQEAEALYRQALELLDRLVRGDHPKKARGIRNLALTLMLDERFDQAETYSRDSLDMYRRLDVEGPEIAEGIDYLGLLALNKGRFGHAEEVFRQALELSRPSLGEDHPFVAFRLSNLGFALALQGRYGEAASALRRSLEVYRARLDGEPFAVSGILVCLALLRYAEGDTGGGESLLQEALISLRRLPVEKGQEAMGPMLTVAEEMGRSLEEGRLAPMLQGVIGALATYFPPDHQILETLRGVRSGNP